ncbi:MAG TPA: hypothetical protein H9955_05825 [Candidatus Mediterraneibacter cottocaccae]|nr:hypothetical protein [Candidatus Mediterraneibacter cottocaccae]
MNQDFFRTNWIWMQDEIHDEREYPCIVYFRKEFNDAGKIRISANCRYKLYINGVFVQEGPQKGNAETAYADSADLGKYVRKGEKNTAAVEVLYYPEDPARRNDSLYYSQYPCLYIEDLGDAVEKALNGKEGWRYTMASHIGITGEPFNPAPIHGEERVHARADLAGWMESGYDDSSWQEAKPYNFLQVNKPVAPFNMEERTIPPMRHESCRFEGVVCVRESSAQTADSLKEQWEKMLSGTGTVEIPANTTQIVEISAGEEMCGYPAFIMAGGKEAEITFLCSECYGVPQPDVVTPSGARKLPPLKGDRTDYVHGVLEGTTDVYYAAGYGTKEKPEKYTPFLFRTFRYIQVKITTKDQGMSLLGYDYLSTGYPLEVKTHLETSDESLNRIWDISMRSLKRCMHETYVDCPFYEQLQYTMDSRAEILFAYAVSGDDRLARQCMDSFRKTQRSDGILQASAPAVGVNVIPGFSIFYILMVHDHMMYFGDKALVREHFACVDRVLEFFHNHLTEKGLVGSVGGVLFRHKYWSFIDWCPEWNESVGVPAAALQGDGSITMESLLYLCGLLRAAELAEYIGREGVAEEYRERAEKVRAAVQAYCTGKDGLIQDGPGLELYSTHCQVWAALTDTVSEEQGRKNLERTFGTEGIPQCSVSMSFYLLEAFRKTGMLEKADQMWEPWRWMVKNNMTTCAENFTDQRSDCHAWGALALYALPAVYLGIRPVKPGFAEYEKKTDLGHLSWIRGEIVTPRGILRIDESRADEK